MDFTLSSTDPSSLLENISKWEFALPAAKKQAAKNALAALAACFDPKPGCQVTTHLAVGQHFVVIRIASEEEL